MNVRKVFVILLLLAAFPVLGMAQSNVESTNQTTPLKTYPQSGYKIDDNTRMLHHPEWDGAVVSGPWLDMELSYEDWDKATQWLIVPTFATTLPQFEKLELGGRLYLLHADPDSDLLEDGFGIGDIDVWAKYQFFKDRKIDVSGGLLFTLPTGDNSMGSKRASGELNIELFGGVRYHVSDATAIVGHLGIRKNSDAELELKHGREFEYEGKTQFQFDVGVLHQLNPNIAINAGFHYANEGYDGLEDDMQLIGGAQYALSNRLALKAGLGLGLDDGAPDFDLILGFNYMI